MRSAAALALSLVFAAGGACGKAQKSEPSPAAVTAPAEEGPRAPEAPPIEPAEPDPPADAAEPPAADPACVEECVQESQMRAVGVEQIRADCERECAARAADPDQSAR